MKRCCLHFDSEKIRSVRPAGSSIVYKVRYCDWSAMCTNDNHVAFKSVIILISHSSSVERRIGCE